MWKLFKKGERGEARRREPVTERRESDLALERAKRELQVSIKDRDETKALSEVVRRHLDANHISQRIELLLLARGK